MVMVKALRFRPGSLLARTNLTLAVSSVLIVIISIAALNIYVITPIAEGSADDEAALLILSSQTWVELNPERRPAFELELAQTHDLIISAQVRKLPAVTLDQPYLTLLQEKLSARLKTPVALMESDELVWANVPMDGVDIQIGFSPERRDVQPLYVGIIIIGLGAAVVFLTSLFIVQRITRPLVQAAERVETFRGGENFDQLPEEGPRELVSLARSINTMAHEISTLLADRKSVV
jgi:two-component system osmolarity sensor histidine kinase EnvZ